MFGLPSVHVAHQVIVTRVIASNKMNPYLDAHLAAKDIGPKPTLVINFF